MGEEKNRSWLEYLRLITPVGLFVIGIFISIARDEIKSVRTDLKDLSAKIYLHQTNDEIHCPKSVVVTRPEFQIYQEFRNKEMQSIKEAINTGFKDLKEDMKNQP